MEQKKYGPMVLWSKNKYNPMLLWSKANMALWFYGQKPLKTTTEKKPDNHPDQAPIAQPEKRDGKRNA